MARGYTRPINAGDRFGQLTILREVERIKGKRAFEVKCNCEAETVCVRKLILLTTGETKSCGCLFLRGNKRSHGMSKTKTYSVWQGMLQRCNNPDAPNYNHYGGRGIKVCDRWLVFENFLADMGERPSPKHEISRIENDNNYEPGNAEWSDDVVFQRRNRRTGLKANKTSRFRGVDLYRDKRWRSRIIVKRGETLTLGYFKTEIEAAEAYDAVARLHRGFILNFPENQRGEPDG